MPDPTGHACRDACITYVLRCEEVRGGNDYIETTCGGIAFVGNGDKLVHICRISLTPRVRLTGQITYW